MTAISSPPNPETKGEKALRNRPPAMRQSPDDTELDASRSDWAFNAWAKQDAVYRLRDRDIEESVRMLAGQQWWVYHHLLGWQDISYWMSDDEKRWRQRPVFNRIMPWFILTHAKMTENPFNCTFIPGPDHHDGELAEALDTLFRGKWRDLRMVGTWARTAAWIIVGGTGFTQTRVDLNKGDYEDWVGRATLPVIGPDDSPILGPDGQPVTQEVDGVPFDKDFKPLAILRHDGLQQTGKPHRARRGELVVDVHSPLEVRGTWGPLPWEEQRRHTIRSFLTPEDVFNRWGVECESDVTDLPTGSGDFLERLLFGTGFYGAASTPLHPWAGSMNTTETDGYVCVQSDWFAPDDKTEGMEQTEESPGGRLLITAKGKVLRDGVRPIPFKWTSGVRCYEFLRLPGRPWGSTPLEMMKSPQKSYNQGWKQILENRSLVSNPQQIYDLDSGLKAHQIDNMPARQYGIRMKPGVENPIKWITPPAMGPDVWRAQAALAQELAYLGSNTGTDPQQAAKIVGRKASGELMKELRFNDDRFLGPTMRRVAEEMGRMVEDWRTIFPYIYTRETVLHFTGEDRAARTTLLLPELFNTADCTVQPDIESMMPEGKGERRDRAYAMWKDGWFGDVKEPKSRRMAHEAGRFPSSGILEMPGGVHRAAAMAEHTEMLAGRPAVILEWQDHSVHLDEHETFMSSKEWLRLPDPIRELFTQHRELHIEAMIDVQRKALERAREVNPPPAVPGAERAPASEEGAAA